MEIGQGIMVKRTASEKLMAVTELDDQYLQMQDPYNLTVLYRITPADLDAAIASGDLKFCWTLEKAKDWD